MPRKFDSGEKGVEDRTLALRTLRYLEQKLGTNCINSCPFIDSADRACRCDSLFSEFI